MCFRAQISITRFGLFEALLLPSWFSSGTGQWRLPGKECGIQVAGAVPGAVGMHSFLERLKVSTSVQACKSPPSIAAPLRGSERVLPGTPVCQQQVTMGSPEHRQRPARLCVPCSTQQVVGTH